MFRGKQRPEPSTNPWVNTKPEILQIVHGWNASTIFACLHSCVLHYSECVREPWQKTQSKKPFHAAYPNHNNPGATLNRTISLQGGGASRNAARAPEINKPATNNCLAIHIYQFGNQSCTASVLKPIFKPQPKRHRLQAPKRKNQGHRLTRKSNHL